MIGEGIGHLVLGKSVGKFGGGNNTKKWVILVKIRELIDQRGC
jgi:hypothetical protein